MSVSKLANPEEVLRTVVWYGAHRYDDKPSQFWNQMRIAAETLGDTEAASIFDAYCENGCPITNEHAQAARILAALREPSGVVVDAMVMTLYPDIERSKLIQYLTPFLYNVHREAIRASVAAAEQEVGRE